MTATTEEPIRRRRFNLADYHRMGEAGILSEDDRVELIDGEIIEMTPIGSPHGGRVKRLVYLLTQAVGPHAIVAAQDPVILDDRSEPEPDLALLRPRADFYTESHPRPTDVLLLIEVADTSLQKDRQVKVPLYARHGIPETWIVDTEHQRVLRFAGLRDGTYQTEEEIDLNRPAPLPGLPGRAVDLAALF
jgi:Uma2 family endonuclease